MAIETFDPPTLARPHGYHHAVAASGKHTVYTAGQVGIDAEENLAEGYRAQAYQAMVNLADCLEAAGASLAQVVRLTMYVVDPTPDNLDELYAGMGKAGKERGAKSVPATLVGITTLTLPGAVFEVDAIAVT